VTDRQAHVPTQPRQEIDVADPVLAEAGVVAEDDALGPHPPRHDATDELVGRGPGELEGEIEDEAEVETEFVEQAQSLAEGRDHRDAAAAQDFFGVLIERDQGGRDALGAGPGSGPGRARADGHGGRRRRRPR